MALQPLDETSLNTPILAPSCSYPLCSPLTFQSPQYALSSLLSMVCRGGTWRDHDISASRQHPLAASAPARWLRPIRGPLLENIGPEVISFFLVYTSSTSTFHPLFHYRPLFWTFAVHVVSSTTVILTLCRSRIASL